MVDGGVVGEGLVGNLGDELAVVLHAHNVVGGDNANLGAVEAPLGEDVDDLLLAAFLSDEQHALLGFGQHDLVGGHTGLALGDEVELDAHAEFAARSHFAGGAGEAGGAHVLDAEDCSGLHGFEAGLEEQLLEEGVAHLDVGALLLGALGELLGGHGGAVDAIAAGLGSDIEDGISNPCRFCIKDLVFADEAEGEGVEERVSGVAGLETGFSAKVGDAEAVAVAGDAVGRRRWRPGGFWRSRLKRRRAVTAWVKQIPPLRCGMTTKGKQWRGRAASEGRSGGSP